MFKIGDTVTLCNPMTTGYDKGSVGIVTEIVGRNYGVQFTNQKHRGMVDRSTIFQILQPEEIIPDYVYNSKLYKVLK